MIMSTLDMQVVLVDSSFVFRRQVSSARALGPHILGCGFRAPRPYIALRDTWALDSWVNSVSSLHRSLHAATTARH